jgi:aldehyde:ferredoxin oxidoreductase
LRFNSFFLLPHAEAIRLATGIPMYTGSFIALGNRCYDLERIFNMREGLTAQDDSLPARLTETPQDPNDPTSVVPLAKMLKTYYKVRGWDANGVPKKRTYKKLGVESAYPSAALSAKAG